MTTCNWQLKFSASNNLLLFKIFVNLTSAVIQCSTCFVFGHLEADEVAGGKTDFVQKFLIDSFCVPKVPLENR